MVRMENGEWTNPILHSRFSIDHVENMSGHSQNGEWRSDKTTCFLMVRMENGEWTKSILHSQLIMLKHAILFSEWRMENGLIMRTLLQYFSHAFFENYAHVDLHCFVENGE